MTVTDVRKSPDDLTMEIVSEYPASLERVWQLLADPRQLERWWGPPTHPATFVDFDLTPGGSVSYFMTSPDGDRYHGWWRVREVEPPHRLEVEDGFADDEGAPNPDMPTNVMLITLTAAADGTQMTIRSTFPTLEAMEQTLAMGAEEGMKAALGQIDDLLTAATA
jgi:uncharacterized protein YndB with AHSA1/START domain